MSWEKPAEVWEALVAVEAEAASAQRCGGSQDLEGAGSFQNLLILQEFPIPFWEKPAQTETSLDSLNE